MLIIMITIITIIEIIIVIIGTVEVILEINNQSMKIHLVGEISLGQHCSSFESLIIT